MEDHASVGKLRDFRARYLRAFTEDDEINGIMREDLLTEVLEANLDDREDNEPCSRENGLPAVSTLELVCAVRKLGKEEKRLKEGEESVH